MKGRSTSPVLAAILAGGLAVSGNVLAGDSSGSFEVTVTNLTRDQQFTPILVASHRPGIKLFDLGQPASAELQTLAEEGNVTPLTDALLAMPGVLDVTNSGGLLEPGASVTISVDAEPHFSHLSVAAMLIPTNDGFFSVTDVAAPRGPASVVLTSVAYDSGSERNDELCASIPGPSFIECGGPGGGGAPSGDEEGYVHVHAGIHGTGDMDASQRDWRNPVARISVRRVP